jgi:gliding motility-associated-like protein/uncharacterized repeat protein (TIGR01451 family)
MQRRVGLVLTDTKKMSDYCLFIILFIVGMTSLPARANTLAAGTVALPGTALMKGMGAMKALPYRPTAKSSIQWTTYTYTPNGADQSVITGDRITYRVYVQNTGTEELTNIIISDVVPQHTILAYGTNGSTLNGATGQVTLVVPSLAVGATAFLEIGVDVGSPLTGVTYINNTGYVDIGDGTGAQRSFSPQTIGLTSGVGSDNGIPATRVPVDNGQNSISWKSVSAAATGKNGNVQSGDIISYVIYVRNTGTLPLTNVVVTDYIPTYTTFHDSPDASPDANNLMTWTIPEIAVGATVSRSFRVKVATDLTGGSSIDNTAYVNNGNGKGTIPTYPAMPGQANQPNIPATNTGPSTSIPIVKQTSFESWKLLVNSSGESTVTAGEEILYIIYVRNTGNIAISDLNVYDPVPEFTTFKSVENGGSYLSGSRSVYWKVNNLAAGAIATVRFTVTVNTLSDEIKAITNTARVEVDTSTRATYRCDPADPNCDKGIVTSINTTGKSAGMVITNVITPNRDGKNDYFIVRGIDKFPNSTLYIFNRWGGTVYVNKNYQNQWGGEGLSEGTYYYRLELNNPTGGTEVFKGWVMIIR